MPTGNCPQGMGQELLNVPRRPSFKDTSTLLHLVPVQRTGLCHFSDLVIRPEETVWQGRQNASQAVGNALETIWGLPWSGPGWEMSTNAYCITFVSMLVLAYSLDRRIPLESMKVFTGLLQAHRFPHTQRRPWGADAALPEQSLMASQY